MPNAEFQVQKVGLAGDGWETVCRAAEAEALQSVESPWDDYRRRWRFFLAAFLGPFIFALGYPLWLLIGNVPVFYVFVAWLPLYVVAVMWLYGFPCPRCSRPFFCKRLDRNIFARCCLHCGLPKWSSVEAESNPSD